MNDVMTIRSRPYEGTVDLPSMLELAGEAWADEGLHEYPRGPRPGGALPTTKLDRSRDAAPAA